MSETGYTEDCCWTFIRQYCKAQRAGQCPCRCHTDWPATEDAKAQLAAAVARAAALEAERDQYRAAVAAADDLARVLDQEVMPRYMELIDAYGLGDSVVDPMSRQALDAYRDARAALAGQPAAPVAAAGGGAVARSVCRACNGVGTVVEREDS